MDEISGKENSKHDQDNEPGDEELAEIKLAFKEADLEMEAGDLLTAEDIRQMAAEILAIRRERML